MSGYEKIIESFLLDVEKPARYTGGEYNTPNMNKPTDLRVCLCFPDLYEVGMSNLGIRILYHLLNEQENIIAERCFAPKEDLISLLKAHNVPLLSIDTKKPLIEFDIIGFSMQFELLYTNALLMLDLAGIPFYAKDRDESYPLIIAGGPSTVNPEPFAPFMDIVVIGDGEEALLKLSRLYIEHKAKGYNKAQYLIEARQIEGVYIPSFFEVIEGRFCAIDSDKAVRQTYVKDYEEAYFPTAILVPNIEAIHDRPVIELFRGCPNGCRFCQAGFSYRPIRIKSHDKVVELTEKTILETGFEEVSLASLSSSDYRYLEKVVKSLTPFADTHNVNLSLPSLRMDSFKGIMADKSRLGSLTFAPEAGTQRLRDIINKNLTVEDIDNALSQAFMVGYSSIKLYFMIGLPTESSEDLDGIKDLVLRIKMLYSEKAVNKRRPLNISISTAVFIPKPLTPFQWEAQLDYDTIVKRLEYLKQILKIKGVRFSYHDIKSSVIEAALARGDRRLSEVIVDAYNKGARFDSWSECFDYNKWAEAFKASGIDMSIYLSSIDTCERLPWDFIDFYVSKDYLLLERERALNSISVPSCLKGCRQCSERPIGCDI